MLLAETVEGRDGFWYGVIMKKLSLMTCDGTIQDLASNGDLSIVTC